MVIGGLLVLTGMWGALTLYVHHAFYLHMVMHMGVVAVAAPLIAIGLAGSRWDPVPRAPRFFAPIPISLIELVVVWGWHAPALHHAARHTLWGLVLEQGMFFACGLLLWLSAFGGQPPRDPDRAGAGVLGLLMTMMHMILLGALLAMTPRPLYHHASHSGPSPLQDQHLGGLIMLVGGGVSYLIGGLVLTKDLLRPRAIQSIQSIQSGEQL
jgi:putative membrane protein